LLASSHVRAFRVILGIVVFVAAAVGLGLWREHADQPRPDRIMSKIRLAGFKKLGHDLGSKAGSDPSTDGAGYMFYGPRLDSAQLKASLSGITVRWIPVQYPHAGGDRVIIALGDVDNDCRVGIESMNRDVPAGFLGGASDSEIAQMRAGQMDILDVGVSCQ
jgi:hypothetical protein